MNVSSSVLRLYGVQRLNPLFFFEALFGDDSAEYAVGLSIHLVVFMLLFGSWYSPHGLEQERGGASYDHRRDSRWPPPRLILTLLMPLGGGVSEMVILRQPDIALLLFGTPAYSVFGIFASARRNK